jgi:hypothetical protein
MDLDNQMHVATREGLTSLSNMSLRAFFSKSFLNRDASANNLSQWQRQEYFLGVAGL